MWKEPSPAEAVSYTQLLQRSKVTNLRLAAARLDGLTLRPGETLSFWRAVGKPTRRRG